MVDVPDTTQDQGQVGQVGQGGEGGQASTTWSQWLQSPANRALLISAGAQMLQPSWGGPLANFGQAVAQGTEAQAATQKEQQTQTQAYEQLKSSERQAELNRANQIRVAQIGAESRHDVAALRSQAMLERAAIIGARTPSQQAHFMNLTGRLFSTLMANNPLAGPGRKTTDELWTMAMDQAQQSLIASGVLPPSVGSGGQPPPSTVTPPPPSVTTPPVTPPPPPVTSGKGAIQQEAPVTTPPPSTPPPSTPPPPGFMAPLTFPGLNFPAPSTGGQGSVPGAPTTTTSPPQSTMTWEQFIAGGSTRDPRNARAILTNRTARQEVLRLHPEWAPQIRAAMQAWNIPE